ncbi:MAG: hypothetical protein H7Y43_00925 [Akkermansiaceae bacterium]|nr:hypothetical protein [Verrucomicrobiales bacterium]
MTTQELNATLEAFKEEHGIFHYQDALIRALVKSVTLEKVEFTGPGFRITIRNPKPKLRASALSPESNNQS